MSRKDRNKSDNTDQLNDLFVGGFDQDFDDELFVESDHLDQAFISGTSFELGSDSQLEVDGSDSADITVQLERGRSGQASNVDERVSHMDGEYGYGHDFIDLEEVVDDGYEDIVVVAEVVTDPVIGPVVEQANQEPVSKSVSVPNPGSSGRPMLVAAWVALVLFPLIAGVVTYAKISSQPDVWKVRAEVQYRGSAWTETQDVAVKSRSLIAPVADQFGVPIGEFETNLDAGLLTGTQVLRIEYSGTDGRQAEEIVTALAASYITRTSELTPDGVFETLEAQRSEVAEALRLAKGRQSEIAPGVASQLVAERAAVAAEIDALEQRLTVAESKILDVSLENLDLNANRVPILLTEPFRFSEPVGPNPTLWAGAGLFVAALMSSAVAVVLLTHTSKRRQTWLGAKR